MLPTMMLVEIVRLFKTNGAIDMETEETVRHLSLLLFSISEVVSAKTMAKIVSHCNHLIKVVNSQAWKMSNFADTLLALYDTNQLQISKKLSLIEIHNEYRETVQHHQLLVATLDKKIAEKKNQLEFLNMEYSSLRGKMSSFTREASKIRGEKTKMNPCLHQVFIFSDSMGQGMAEYLRLMLPSNCKTTGIVHRNLPLPSLIKSLGREMTHGKKNDVFVLLLSPQHIESIDVPLETVYFYISEIVSYAKLIIITVPYNFANTTNSAILNFNRGLLELQLTFCDLEVVNFNAGVEKPCFLRLYKKLSKSGFRYAARCIKGRMIESFCQYCSVSKVDINWH